MPMYPLDGCRAKIERAHMHIGELVEEVNRFTVRPPYRVDPVINESIDEIVFLARADPECPPVPVAVPLIAGEVADHSPRG